ncbi:MAG: antibiotic ABC transporter ATP-binding protein [Sphingobacteriaceae bacterium]|nr:antibiotic ABC transporter ATP-binding protein [Sphingobacteriaceae bacterium]
MKKLFSVLKYTKDYRGYTALNIVFNIFFAIFSVFSISLTIPFLELIFKKDVTDYQEIINQTSPAFKLSMKGLTEWGYYQMSLMIIEQGKAQTLLIICLVVFLATFLKNISRYFAMYFLAPIRNGVVRDLRNKMMKKSLELPLSYFSDERKGDMMSRMTTDVIEIEWSIMQSLELIFREPLTIIISLATLIFISPYLTLYVFLLLPVAGLVVALVSKSLKSRSAKGKEVFGQLFNIMEETLGALKVIKAFTGERFVQNKFEKVNQNYNKISVSLYRRADLTSPISETVVLGVLLLILYIGGCMVFDGTGALSGAAFLGYFAVASQIVPPIKQITLAYNNIQKGLASEERIDKILQAENPIVNKANATKIDHFEKGIEFKNVSFSYKKGDDGYVLRNINLSIPKGKTIALVGQSGSGKTTLADMIPRFYDTDLGEITIDGIALKELDIESLRKQIGVVTQESILFNDTIENNIAFGLDTIDSNKVIEAAKVANAHEFILQQPNGYQTNIGDRGGKLSGGQRQRISIARAILKNPPILILDEATSALDTESERLVQDALNNLMKNRTSIVIAHRLSTIINADEIFVINKGELAEKGSHQELLQKDGIYKKLFDMQNFK